MFKISSLLKPLEGVALPGSAEIAAVLAKAEAERAGARRELERLADARANFLRNDDDAALSRQAAAEEAAHIAIEKCDLAIPELRERLRAAHERDRGDAMAAFRKRMAGAVTILRAAVHQAHGANQAVEEIWVEAQRDLGKGAADQAVPNCRFGGFLTSDGVAYWDTWTTRALATPWRAPQTARPASPPVEAIAPPPRDPSPGADGNVEVIIGRAYRNSPFEVWEPGTRVRLPTAGAVLLVRSGDAIYAPGGAGHDEPPAIAPTTPGRVMTERQPRPPLPETPPGGFLRCRVVRGGYSDTDGRQCSRGDILHLPEATAIAAAGNGAVEILPPAKPAAADPAAPAEPVASPPVPDDAPAAKRRKST